MQDEEKTPAFVATLNFAKPIPDHLFPSASAQSPGRQRLLEFVRLELAIPTPSPVSLQDAWLHKLDRHCRTVLISLHTSDEFSLAQILTEAVSRGVLASHPTVCAQSEANCPQPPPPRREWYECGVFPENMTIPKLSEAVNSALSRAGLQNFSLISFSLRRLPDSLVAVRAQLPRHLLWVLNFLPAPFTQFLDIHRLVQTHRWCSRCLRKGHTASACQAKARCTRCGSEDHQLRSCPQARGHCFACGSQSHLFHHCHQVKGVPRPVSIPAPPSALFDDDGPIPSHSPFSVSAHDQLPGLHTAIQQLQEEVKALRSLSDTLYKMIQQKDERLVHHLKVPIRSDLQGYMRHLVEHTITDRIKELVAPLALHLNVDPASIGLG